eukprot:scaffold37865_cov361-Skeletonema_dohrnii-CCMP3373.AAC.2
MSRYFPPMLPIYLCKDTIFAAFRAPLDPRGRPPPQLFSIQFSLRVSKRDCSSNSVDRRVVHADE